MFPLAKYNKQEVLVMLRPASKGNKDAFLAKKQEQISVAKLPKYMGTFFLGIGILATVLIITAIVGVPVAIVGWWMRRRSASNIQVIEAACAELLAEH